MGIDLINQRKKMIKKSYFLFIIIFLLLTACKYAFLVNKDKIVQYNIGFVIISTQGDFFIPSNVDTLRNVIDDFLSRKIYEKGFRISLNIHDRANLVKIYADSLTQNMYIVPIELSYLKRYYLPKKINQSLEIYYSIPIFKNDTVIVECKVNNINNQIIQVSPFLSQSKIQYLENEYINSINW